MQVGPRHPRLSVAVAAAALVTTSCGHETARVCPGELYSASLSVQLPESVSSVSDVHGVLCAGRRCITPRGVDVEQGFALVHYEATATVELTYDLTFADAAGVEMARASGAVTPTVTYPNGRQCGGKLDTVVTSS
jgi:hypothetical protein